MRTGSPSPVSAMPPSPGFASEISSTNDTGKASYQRLSSASLPRTDTKTPDEGSQIELWRESATFETDHEVGGIATRLYRACLDSLTYLLRFLKTPISKLQVNLLRRCHATIKLWGDGHDVEGGNLDRILDSSRNLQHMTLSVLNQLCKALLSGLKLHIASDMNDDALVLELTCRSTEIYRQTNCILQSHDCNSDSGSDNGSDSDTSEDDLESSGLTWIVEDVKISTDCLVDLNTTLNFPAVDPAHDDEPSLPKIEQRAAHEYHSDLIRARFPRANPDLVECLGKTSWNRYCRLQQLRESNVEVNTHTETLAQSTAKSQFVDSEFKDSGLGNSIPTAPSVSYAETIISFMTSIAGGNRVRIPPLSAEAKNGAKFECNACGKHIKATNNRDWRKHLFLDIQPYTCFYATCSFNSKPFADRKLWIRHLELDHCFGPKWNAIDCPLCFQTTEAGKSSILIHFARHMEDIALSALPCEVESDAEPDNESDDNTINIESTSDCAQSSNQIMEGSCLYTCRLCRYPDTDHKSLLRHLQDFHNKSADEADLQIERTATNKPEHIGRRDEVAPPPLPPPRSIAKLQTMHEISSQQSMEKLLSGFEPLELEWPTVPTRIALPPMRNIWEEAQHQHSPSSPKDFSKFFSESSQTEDKCSTCMDAFATRTLRHLELYPDSYSCEVCAECFHFEAHLSRHMQSVHTKWEGHQSDKSGAPLREVLHNADEKASLPTYARVHWSNLDVRTLKYYGIEYTRDVDPDYIIVLKELSQHALGVLFEHTQRINSIQVLQNPLAQNFSPSNFLKDWAAQPEEEPRKQSSPPKSGSPISSILDNAILGERGENDRFHSSTQDSYPDFQQWEFDHSLLNPPASPDFQKWKFDESTLKAPVSPPDRFKSSSPETEPQSPSSMVAEAGDWIGNFLTQTRDEHSQELISYPCQDRDCKRIYRRQDARLKHYRRHHPHFLEPHPPRKTISPSTSQQRAPQAQMISQPDQAILKTPESVRQLLENRGFDRPWNPSTAKGNRYGNVERNIPSMNLNGVPIIDDNLQNDFVSKEINSIAVPGSSMPASIPSPDTSIASYAMGQVLTCGRDSCLAQFTGVWAEGNRERHWKSKHGS